MTWILCRLDHGLADSAARHSAPVEMLAAEQAFQQTMTDVVLEGFFTVGDGTELHPDRYEITSVTKVKDGVWRFSARVQYNKKDFPVTLNVPVFFAGDTPVMSLTRQGIQGTPGSVRYATGHLQRRLRRHVGRRRHRWQDVRQHRQERAEVDSRRVSEPDAQRRPRTGSTSANSRC